LLLFNQHVGYEQYKNAPYNFPNHIAISYKMVKNNYNCKIIRKAETLVKE